MSLIYNIKSGKNSKLRYFAKNHLRLLIPNCIFHWRLEKRLKEIETRSDREYILDRVSYYNRVDNGTVLPNTATTLSETKMRKPKVYYFDAKEITRWFDQKLRWIYLPGDINYTPEHPSIVKSRPIAEGNSNGVLLKLNKIRHYIFVEDKKNFREKIGIALFRGNIRGKAKRQKFFAKYYGNKVCNLGDTSSTNKDHPEWLTKKMTIKEQLNYRYILAIEGVDVSSNLKWIMSSNSVAIMPKPTFETWFMEGRLKANYHYIEIKSDYSDLEEKVSYYNKHPEEAEKIVEHANEYVRQFLDTEREELIGLKVMDEYFRKTMQY